MSRYLIRLASVLAGLHLPTANTSVDVPKESPNSAGTKLTAYSMLTHDGRRIVSHGERTKRRRCLLLLGSEKYMIRGINILYPEKLDETLALYAINMI